MSSNFNSNGNNEYYMPPLIALRSPKPMKIDDDSLRKDGQVIRESKPMKVEDINAIKKFV